MTRRWLVITLGVRALLYGGFFSAIWFGSWTALVFVLVMQTIALEYATWMLGVLAADVRALQESHHG